MKCKFYSFFFFLNQPTAQEIFSIDDCEQQKLLVEEGAKKNLCACAS